MRFAKPMLMLALLLVTAGARADEGSSTSKQQLQDQQKAIEAYQQALETQEAEYRELALEYELLAQVDQDAQKEFQRAKGKMGRGRLGDKRVEGLGARRHLEQLRLLKLLEFIDLQEDQETEFIVMFRSHRRQAQELGKQRQEMIQQLHELVENADAVDRELFEQTQRVRQLNEERLARMQEFAANMQGVLSARQFAKLIIFQEVFEEQLLGQLGRFRNRPGGSDLSPGMLNDN